MLTPGDAVLLTAEGERQIERTCVVMGWPGGAVPDVREGDLGTLTKYYADDLLWECRFAKATILVNEAMVVPWRSRKKGLW